MSADELDQSYSALSESLGRIGADKAPLLLATLTLALIARDSNLQNVLSLILQAERLAQT